MTEWRKTERLIHHVYDESQKLITNLLHEDIGQRFTGIALQAGVLHKRLLKDHHPLAQQAHDVVVIIGECITMVRDVARGVYPLSLHSTGLGPALESLAERIHARYKTPCLVTREKSAVVVPFPISLQIYRLAEIALFAAIKDHGADSIAMKYGMTPSFQFRISYSDRKPDQTSAKIEKERQLLRSRARLIGASIRIRNGKKRTVTIILPSGK